jgi:hypothetical protein
MERWTTKARSFHSFLLVSQLDPDGIYAKKTSPTYSRFTSEPSRTTSGRALPTSRPSTESPRSSTVPWSGSSMATLKRRLFPSLRHKSQGRDGSLRRSPMRSDSTCNRSSATSNFTLKSTSQKSQILHLSAKLRNLADGPLSDHEQVAPPADVDAEWPNQLPLRVRNLADTSEFADRFLKVLLSCHQIILPAVRRSGKVSC